MFPEGNVQLIWRTVDAAAVKETHKHEHSSKEPPWTWLIHLCQAMHSGHKQKWSHYFTLWLEAGKHSVNLGHTDTKCHTDRSWVTAVSRESHHDWPNTEELATINWERWKTPKTPGNHGKVNWFIVSEFSVNSTAAIYSNCWESAQNSFSTKKSASALKRLYWPLSDPSASIQPPSRSL